MAGVITDTSLRNNTKKFLSSIITPSFGTAPFLDLTLRLGKLERNDGAEWQERIETGQETLQTPAIGAAWTTETTTRIARYGQIFGRLMFPVEFDEGEILGSGIENLSSMFAGKLKIAISSFAEKISYNFFNSATWTGLTYDVPMCGFQTMLPFASTGSYFGVARNTYTSTQHSYANASAYAGGCTTVCTTFFNSTTGFLAKLREAKNYAMKYAGNKFVCFVDASTYSFFGRYFMETGGYAPTTGGVAWLPDKAVFPDSNLTLGKIGFSSYIFEDILIVLAPGIDTTVANGYLVAYECHSSPNVSWKYNALESGKKGMDTKFPFYFTDWQRLDRSTIWGCGLFAPFQIVVRDTSVCAAIKHNGTYGTAI